ncbi:MAG: DUF1425 domain-containing protein [Kiritimatiellae bacterium]|jgi:uncharacterized protein YcfL|nr:DUF1425 domain-containing protein [Kiritimatiellia bacterium]
MKYGLLILLVALSFLGCRSTPRMNVTQIEGSAEKANVVFDSSVIGKSLEVLSVNTAKKDNGIYQVQTVVKSKYKETQNIQYKYEWMDADGIQLESSPWKPIVIYGSARANLAGVSTSSAATNYRLLIAEN